MEKLIELNNENIKISNKIMDLKKPEHIYIPILPNSKLLIDGIKKVKIGTPLISNNKNIITSPISGEITSLKKVLTLDGETKALEIKNDFEEACAKESKIKKNILNIKKEVLDKALGLFNIDLTNKKNLVLNCVDDEPYVLTESFYLFTEYTDFLEVIDKLSEIYNLKIAIAIKASSNFSISELMNYLGMYPNIKLEIIPNLYLLGQTKFLLKHLSLKEEEATIIKASDFYYLSNFLKKGRLKTDKLITMSGNNIENPSIIRIKIGTPIKELAKEIKLKEKNTIFIANGLMSGKEIHTNNFIITEDITSILIMKKESLEKINKKEEKCINCGACIDICPVGINPILLKEKEYYETNKNKCLKCGLCSYICPVYIDFNCSNRKGERND